MLKELIENLRQEVMHLAWFLMKCMWGCSVDLMMLLRLDHVRVGRSSSCTQKCEISRLERQVQEITVV